MEPWEFEPHKLLLLNIMITSVKCEKKYTRLFVNSSNNEMKNLQNHLTRAPRMWMIHLADGNKQKIYFRPEPKKGGALRCIGVNSLRNKPICGNILFVHAFLGCDTTSGLFGIGKADWIEICQREWEFPWTSWSVQKCELVKRPATQPRTMACDT